ncbi:MAG: FKBP-type peptidyl-prolyl cis-trans isomerase [Ilumatobacteraceae bacterium]
MHPRPRRSPRSLRSGRSGGLVTHGLALALVTALAACGGGDGDGGDGDAAGDDTVVTDVELEPVDDGSGADDPADDEPTAGDDGSGADDPADDRPTVEVPDEIPTELTVTDLVDGDGPAARPNDSVVVDYIGVVTATGEEFDNSYDRDIPFSVRLGEGRVIEGWDEGLVGVRSGGRRQIDIPAELAYGDNPPGGSAISAGDALTFVVDVRAVIESVDPDDEPDLDLEPSVGRDDLDIDDVEVGDGPALEPDQTAIVHLMLLRGDDLEVLESTWQFDDPAQVVMSPGGAIDGLVDGLIGMRVGGLRVITMPPSLAFGPEGIPSAGLSGESDVIIVARLVGLY